MKVTLYDLSGPLSISGGLGASYGATATHGLIFWVSALLGAVVGFGTFVAIRRVAARAADSVLIPLYVGTPVCVLAATIVSAWAVRAIA